MNSNVDTIVIIYGYSAILAILTFATTNNKAPLITGIFSVVFFILGSQMLYQLVKYGRGEKK